MLDSCEGAARNKILKVCPYFEQLAGLMPRLSAPAPSRRRTSTRARRQAVATGESTELTLSAAAHTAPIHATPDTGSAVGRAPIGATPDTGGSVGRSLIGVVPPTIDADLSPGLLELQRLLLVEQYEHQCKTHKIELEQCKSNLLVGRALKRDKLRQVGIPDTSVLPHIEYESNWEAFW